MKYFMFLLLVSFSVSCTPDAESDLNEDVSIRSSVTKGLVLAGDDVYVGNIDGMSLVVLDGLNIDVWTDDDVQSIPVSTAAFLLCLNNCYFDSCGPIGDLCEGIEVEIEQYSCIVDCRG